MLIAKVRVFSMVFTIGYDFCRSKLICVFVYIYLYKMIEMRWTEKERIERIQKLREFIKANSNKPLETVLLRFAGENGLTTRKVREYLDIINKTEGD